MPRQRSRSASVQPDEELRLPRPPGIIRRFWARHPVVADVLIALVCLVFSLVPATTFEARLPGGGASYGTAAVQFARAGIPMAVIVACVLLLLLRRRWPIVPFVASVLVGVTYLFAPVPVGGLLLLVTSYSLAVYRSSRACWIGLAAALGALTAIAAALAAGGVASFQIALNVAVSEVVLGLIGGLIGVNVGNRKRYLEAVIERSRQLLVERDQQGQLAASAERARIAREMHDIVSHSLTVVVALSEGAAATADPVRARGAMEAAAGTARGALDEMRAMLGVLREGEPDAPLVPMAPVEPRDAVAAAQRAGYPVTLAVTGEPGGPPAVRYAIGRIVQEGVTNAMRHSPGASQILVRIDYSETQVVIEVENDGAPVAVPNAAQAGFGLRGLRERAALAGGTLWSGAMDEDRWSLHAELPLGDDGGAESEPAGTAIEERA